MINPTVEIRPDSSSPLCEQSSRQLLKDEKLAAMFDTMLVDVMKFGDVSLQKVRNDAVGFFMGDRELAHIHSYGRIDIPLPYEVGQNLIRLECR